MPPCRSSAGIDASDYDWDRGPMDLGAAASAGIRFFTHKATEGASVEHVHFGEAMRRARDAGIPVLGAYHVVRSSPAPQAQADYFFSYLDEQFPEWRTHPAFFIQVDLEKWPYDAVPAAQGEAFADLAEAQSRKVAIIYASRGQYDNELTGTSHELWNANYPLSYQTGDFQDLYRRAGGDSGPGWVTYSGKTPKIWQYTSSAVIGRQPTCDADAFRGSLDELRALISGRSDEDMPQFYSYEVKPGPGHDAGGNLIKGNVTIVGLPMSGAFAAGRQCAVSFTCDYGEKRPVELHCSVTYKAADGTKQAAFSEKVFDESTPRDQTNITVPANADGVTVFRVPTSDGDRCDTPVAMIVEIS